MILRQPQKKGVLHVNGIDNSNLGADNVHKMMILLSEVLENPLVNKEKITGLSCYGRT
jgi:hypothetical protein